MIYLSEKRVALICIITLIILCVLGPYVYVHQRFYSEPARLTDLKPLPDTDRTNNIANILNQFPMKNKETATEDRQYLFLVLTHLYEEDDRYLYACRSKDFETAYRHRDRCRVLADNAFRTLYNRAKLDSYKRQDSPKASFFEAMVDELRLAALVPRDCTGFGHNI